jgi:uncharacterized membrane protein YesL
VTKVSISHETYNQVFGTVYVALMTNLMVLVACAPFLAALLLLDPVESWPLLVLTGWMCGPALVASFDVFARFTHEGDTAAARTFVLAWRRTFRRSSAISLTVTGATVVLAVDIAVVWGRSVGAVAIPLLATLAALALAAGLLALVAVDDLPGVRVRKLLLAALYLAVRRWYLTLASFLCLALWASLLHTRPVLALGLAAAPVLYVVWANCRFSLRPLLSPPARAMP